MSLVERAARAIGDASEDGNWFQMDEVLREWCRRDARAVLAVFEDAQKPTDDEREMIEKIAAPIIDTAMGDYGSGTYEDYALSDALLAAGFGFRRPASPAPELGDLENHLGRTSEGTALLPALWALAGVSPEPSVELSVETRYPMPDRDDYETQTDWVTAVVMVQGKRQGWLDAKSEPQTEPTKNPCEFDPQTEPSGNPGQFPTDAQVLAALNRFYVPDGVPAKKLSDWSEGSIRAMRAALRAAVETTNENGSRSDG